MANGGRLRTVDAILPEYLENPFFEAGTGKHPAGPSQASGLSLLSFVLTGKFDFCIFISLSFLFTFPCVILRNDLENAYGIYLRFCKFNGSFRLVRKHFL